MHSNVFPAHAGMIPNIAEQDADRPSVPRTRGDDPFFKYFALNFNQCSPHTRG